MAAVAGEAGLAGAVEERGRRLHALARGDRGRPRRKTAAFVLVPAGKGPFPAVLDVFYYPETAPV